VVVVAVVVTVGKVLAQEAQGYLVSDLPVAAGQPFRQLQRAAAGALAP
jgi:hypothetical protein